MTLDSQQTELIGQNLLVSELLRDGVEVARPERDRGIDLIAYLDVDESAMFRACPIQMKASTDRRFGVDRKYERFPGLLLAYVWNVGNPHETETYGLTYAEAVQVVEAMGWSATASWIGTPDRRGGYSSKSITAKLAGLLAPHRMGPGLWRAKVLALTATLPLG